MKTITLSNALITNPQGAMLTVRKKGSEFFMMAGGKIEANETPLEALYRELSEELHLSPTSYSPHLLGTHCTTAINEANTIVTSTIYHVAIPYLEIKPYAEISEIRWLTQADYLRTPLAHLLKEFSIPIWLKMFP